MLLLVSFSSLSQTLKELKVEVKKIYDANYTMDFDAISQLSYHKMVETIGKDQFLKKLDTDFQNEEFRMRLELVMPLFQYDLVQKIAGKSYCIVTYSNPTRYFYEAKLNETTAAQKVASFKESNDAKEVVFEPKRNTINVKRTSKFIAVADETTANQWKFFNWDDSIQRKLFDTIFGSEIKKQLGL